MPSPGMTVGLGLLIALIGMKLLEWPLNPTTVGIIVIVSFILAHFILRFALRPWR